MNEAIIQTIQDRENDAKARESQIAKLVQCAAVAAVDGDQAAHDAAVRELAALGHTPTGYDGPDSTGEES